MSLKENKVIKGDCSIIFNKILNESIDCIITDPPYSINKKGIINDNSLWGYNLDYYRVLKDNSWLCIYCSINT